MIELVPDEHKWRQVMEIIKGRILDGTYQPRAKVPGIRSLTQEFGVSQNTARHALNDLEEQGYVRQVSSIGTFVRPAKEWPQERPDAT
ncbi:winged helix-turn-helix domain-containing protein (plasmid) [Nonomuraea sp. CA-143628]|uniref:winged helix-turn-helix domain-containing protein n=1 Tax=Nonomuraea sp. CA-143628 TaxID=3239997 RepID=UPI003D8BDB62